MMAAGFAELCRVSMSKAETGAWYAPFNNGDGGRQDGGELLEQVGAVACLLELLDDADNNFVVDALRIDLCVPRLAAGRRWRGVCCSS